LTVEQKSSIMFENAKGGLTVSELKISLKAARVNAGIRLLDAAKQIGVGKDTLLKWERHPGLVQARYQKTISEVYKIPIDNIFFA